MQKPHIRVVLRKSDANHIERIRKALGGTMSSSAVTRLALELVASRAGTLRADVRALNAALGANALPGNGEPR